MINLFQICWRRANAGRLDRALCPESPSARRGAGRVSPLSGPAGSSLCPSQSLTPFIARLQSVRSALAGDPRGEHDRAVVEPYAVGGIVP